MRRRMPPETVARGTAPAPNLAGRTPVGEAVVIARTPAGQVTPIAPQSAAVDSRNAAPASPRTPQPAVLRETLASAPAPTVSQVEAAVRAVTPEQAVTEAIRTAAPRQAGLGSLFADLEQIVRAPNAAQPLVPSLVRQAAVDVLSLRVPLDEHLAGADLKQAFIRSGVLFEPRLAASSAVPAARSVQEPARLSASSPLNGLPPATETPTIRPQDGLKAVPTPRDDLKLALLVFRQVLKVWGASFPAPAMSESPKPPLPAVSQTAMQASAPALPADLEAIRHVASALAGLPDELPQRAPLSPEQAGNLAKSLAAALTRRDAPVATAAQTPNAVAPPYRGAPLSAQAVAAPSIAPDAAPQEIAHKLIVETDGALARQTLLQVASLPDQPSQPRAEATQRWNFEVPFATPHGTAIAQFEVSRDGSAVKADPQARIWRARFSLDVEPMGPVHAMIALAGARASVTLWAARAATAAQLNENAAMLGEALRAAELEPADFQFRVGAPPAMAKQTAPGRFMDRAS